MVQVHYGEGVANHTGPESCGCGREAAREALTGVRAGQVWSGESNVVRGACCATIKTMLVATIRPHCRL